MGLLGWAIGAIAVIGTAVIGIGKELLSGTVSREKSYDKKNSDIHTTERLVNTLESYSRKNSSEAEKIEKNCIAIAENHYDEIMEQLKEANISKFYKTGVQRVKNQKNKIPQMIEGSIKNLMAKRMSIDDAECCEILKMDAGKQKETAMRAFCQKVIQEALNNTARKVRLSLMDQLETIAEYLQTLQEGKERIAYEFKQQLDSIVENESFEQYDKEQFCIGPVVTLQAVELVE